MYYAFNRHTGVMLRHPVSDFCVTMVPPCELTGMLSYFPFRDTFTNTELLDLL